MQILNAQAMRYTHHRHNGQSLPSDVRLGVGGILALCYLKG